MKSLGLLVVVWVGAAGCARSAEERQLEAMREEIEAVHDGRDVGHEGARGTAESSMAVPPAYTQTAPPRPPPTVVQLGQSGAGDGEGEPAAEGDPQDSTPRPTIRVSGSARVGRAGWREDQVEQTSPEEQGTAPAAATPLDPDAKRAYDAAIALVNAKRYGDGLDALARFLVKWPDHPYAANAMYWRGECYFARADYARAVEQFEGVLARFPAGAKAPDALLKLGMSHQKLGNAMKARECFDRLAQQYPDSDAARRIPAAARAASSSSASGAQERP